MPIFGKKRQFCQNYTILWAKKVNRMPFLSDFHEKIDALMPIFCPKNVHCLRNTQLSWLYIFFKKTSILSKAKWSHVIFFKFIIKNSLLSYAYLVKYTSSLLKLQYVMRQKSQQDEDALFYDFFQKNYYSHAHFDKKTYIL